MQNWKCLKDTYSTCTCLNLWINITKYFATTFSPQQPLTQQINRMSDLKSCINEAGMMIPDSLHTMLILKALPSSYEEVQQMILENIQDYCYECCLFITSELWHFQNTSGLDLWTPVLWNISRLQTTFPYPDYNSSYLVLLFHNSVLLYSPFDNSEIPIIVLQICPIVLSCMWTCCHTIPDLLLIQTSPLV